MSVVHGHFAAAASSKVMAIGTLDHVAAVFALDRIADNKDVSFLFLPRRYIHMNNKYAHHGPIGVRNGSSP